MRPALRLVVLGTIVAVVVVVLPLVGLQALPFSVLFDPRGTTPEAVIFWQIRVPRVLAACVGGFGGFLAGAVGLTALQARDYTTRGTTNDEP